MNGARVAFAWAVGVLSYWAAWFVSASPKMPLLWYLPIERKFVFGLAPPGLAMCMFGQLLLAAAAGGGMGALAWLLVRRRELGAFQIRLSAGWCALLLCFVVGYFAFAMWGRVPMITVAPGQADGR